MRLGSLASELTSKNAGNFHITFDIVFADAGNYRRVKESGVLTREAIAALFHVPVEDVLHVIDFAPGQAFKIAMRRALVSGGIGETDVFGAQQFAPLVDVDIP